MKKFCLTVILLAFVSSVPSFAMRVIVNDANDRVVPDRSSKNVIVYTVDDTSYTAEEILQSGYDKDISLQKFENYCMPLFVRDLRTDFVKYVLAFSPKKTIITTPIPVEEVIEPIEKVNVSSRVKLGENEAASYYVDDTLKK